MVAVETTQVTHFVRKQADNLNLWHLRFGHLEKNDLKLLAQRNLVNDLSLKVEAKATLTHYSKITWLNISTKSS
jgi:hypothetical protein